VVRRWSETSLGSGDRRRPLAGALAALLAIGGCGDEGTARPQLLVVVDTDAPVSGQAVRHPELSRDAAIDTVRVDAISTDGSNTSYDLRSFVAPEAEVDASDWPISFGIAATEIALERPVLLRIRAFRGELSVAGESAGKATLDPVREVTIDRFVEVDVPPEGVVRIEVVLAADCLGVLAQFPLGSEPAVTCVDADRRRTGPREGVRVLAEDGGLPPTRAGTWPGAREVPCAAPPPPGAVCVPGGFSVLGDLSFSGIADLGQADSVPLRPMLLSPFFLDATEMTVGRLRELVMDGYEGPMPVARDPSDPTNLAFCTWVGDGSEDPGLPLNCATSEAAEAICDFAGGRLPTEAQWEHAARGRGQRRLWPWGNEPPACCAVSASRQSVAGLMVECTGAGIEVAGSHASLEACGGIADVSRDGVLDLAGSLTELNRDFLRGFDTACWRAEPGFGILQDPICDDDTGGYTRSERGGYWAGGLGRTATPWRASYGEGASNGFRCAYEDGSPP
jgi:formylglycine-generating enzyme required for sulfatase activity